MGPDSACCPGGQLSIPPVPPPASAFSSSPCKAHTRVGQALVRYGRVGCSAWVPWPGLSWWQPQGFGWARALGRQAVTVGCGSCHGSWGLAGAWAWAWRTVGEGLWAWHEAPGTGAVREGGLVEAWAGGWGQRMPCLRGRHAAQAGGHPQACLVFGPLPCGLGIQQRPGEGRTPRTVAMGMSKQHHWLENE